MTRVSMRAACLTIYGLSLCGLLLDARPHGAQRAESSGAPTSPPGSYGGWTHYGGSPDQVRYSTLRQIDKSNVHQLTVAWTYDSQEAGGLQTQPIVVDGVLFGYTPTHKTFALRADTGVLLWTFDSKIEGRGANRGLMYWSSGEDRRVFAAVDQYLYALDARTGQPVAQFGDSGRIDLRAGLGRDPQTQSVRLTTPGVIFKDTLILGGRVSEGLPASPGDIRAYEVRTGKIKWAFHTIPHPGEAGYETWSKDSWTINGGANSWPGMALDVRRGIVYVPTGSAAADFYGANRPGDNLYANCLLALDAETGKRIWSFQFVRHDVWDRDLPSPPMLVTLRRDGLPVDAVVQTTKHGYVFVFDRTNGKTLFPIEYRKFPPSTVPGEVTADTQPIPLKPKPFARQTLDEATLTTRTPEAHQWAVDRLRTFQNGGLFAPLMVGRQTVVFPGFDGGAEWGGAAIDPATGVLYVNANDLAWTGGLAPSDQDGGGRGLYLRQCASCHRDDKAGTPPSIPSLVDVGARRTRPEIEAIIQRGAGRMPGFPTVQGDALRDLVDHVLGRESSTDSAAARPAGSPEVPYRFTGYEKFLDPDGYPAVAPPWGTLNAIDLNTGEFSWQIPLGEYPELTAKGIKNTGTENYGGPIVTAGGVLFIGATNFDRKFRAFDKATGKLLWETTLPFSGNATPATYQVGDRQFVVIAAGGGKGRRGEASGGTYVAFALPVKSGR
jgi:quinoprotein glucose dehydrogenase